MKPPVDAPTSRQSSPAGSTPKRVERVRELLAAARDVRGAALDRELRGLVDLLARLVVAGHEPGHHERLRLRARLREAALDEEDVEALLRHRGSSQTAEPLTGSDPVTRTAMARGDTVSRG